MVVVLMKLMFSIGKCYQVTGRVGPDRQRHHISFPGAGYSYNFSCTDVDFHTAAHSQTVASLIQDILIPSAKVDI
jgi:hypothetical protein